MAELVAVASFWTHDIWHPLHGNGYQFWSGIAGMLTVSWLYAYLHRHNCHERHCWRIGRFPVQAAGQSWTVCKHHHPRGGHVRGKLDPSRGHIAHRHFHDFHVHDLGRARR